MVAPEIQSVQESLHEPPNGGSRRTEIFSQESGDSQTASEFIDSQLQLEAEAREALPYAFDTCTQPLGSLRQNLFSCLTCNPPPASSSEPYTPAGVCYSCSISCHGEHELVELFNKRSFTCDCGTTRLPSSSPCCLRINPATGLKGGAHSEKAAVDNKYNQNFRNKFCGCGRLYDAHNEKGTMYQCLGLGTAEDGGCGEDWWHPGCIVGLGPDWYENRNKESEKIIEGEGAATNGGPGSVASNAAEGADDNDPPAPPGFPNEDDFDQLICWKCVDANPWIKRYGGSAGFLPPVFKLDPAVPTKPSSAGHGNESLQSTDFTAPSAVVSSSQQRPSSKRKASDDEDDIQAPPSPKRAKSISIPPTTSTSSDPMPTIALHESLPPPPSGIMSLFLKDDFRLHLCRCSECFPHLAPHPQLLEEEDIYEPPLSESGDEAGTRSAGTASLLDRGEAALSNVDRVRAIEGVMVYNHLKDKVKSFLQPFAESGQAVGAEDIKAYFEKLRGDAEAIKAAGGAAVDSDGGGGVGEGDNRREQGGY